jgi:hypothetical protein
MNPMDLIPFKVFCVYHHNMVLILTFYSHKDNKIHLFQPQTQVDWFLIRDGIDYHTLVDNHFFHSYNTYTFELPLIQFYMGYFVMSAWSPSKSPSRSLLSL